MNWCQRYHTYGIQGLVDGSRNGNNRKLSQEQVDDLAKRLIQYRPSMVLGDPCSNPEYWTSKDFLRAIKFWYGVTYISRGSYYNLLDRAGYYAD